MIGLALIRSWFLDTTVRTLKTGAQTLVGTLAAGAAGVLPSNIGLEADLKVAGLAMAVCVLHNVAGLPNPWAGADSGADQASEPAPTPTSSGDATMGSTLQEPSTPVNPWPTPTPVSPAPTPANAGAATWITPTTPSAVVVDGQSVTTL